jgi:hypothetical protein
MYMKRIFIALLCMIYLVPALAMGDSINVTATVYQCTDYLTEPACTTAPVTCYWYTSSCHSSPASFFQAGISSVLLVAIGSGALFMLLRTFFSGKLEMIIAGVIIFLVIVYASTSYFIPLLGA